MQMPTWTAGIYLYMEMPTWPTCIYLYMEMSTWLELLYGLSYMIFFFLRIYIDLEHMKEDILSLYIHHDFKIPKHDSLAVWAEEAEIDGSSY